jgi:putative transposase
MSVPGGTYLVTRTTVMSLFLLTPSTVVNQIMEYCIAWAARGRGIVIHAVSVQSNHFHIVLTDREGKLSEFMQELNRCSARCLLAYYRGRFPHRRIETIWTNARSFSAVLLVNTNAVLDELVYTYTNPVKDGLVRDYRKWPGFNTRPSDWRDGIRTACRPSFFFKNTPESLTYAVQAPTQLGTEIEQIINTVELHVRAAQEQASTNLAAQRRGVAGAKAVLAASPFDAPAKQREPSTCDPHLAAGSDAHAMKLAKHALKQFRLAYRAAWKSFKSGARAVFPGGTLLMKQRYGLPCEVLDACWCVRAT